MQRQSISQTAETAFLKHSQVGETLESIAACCESHEPLNACVLNSDASAMWMTALTVKADAPIREEPHAVLRLNNFGRDVRVDDSV
jgi:hypothetical protein